MKLLLTIMKNFCFIGGILITNTYTYLLTKLYMHRKYYLLIEKKDLPKNDLLL
jgi:hypothetical protein